MLLSDKHLEARLSEIARATPWFFTALEAGRSLGLKSWCIGAGAVRNLVWDHLHGYATPSQLADIDLAYFDGENLREERDREFEAELHRLCPAIPWEVTNQAAVHHWFEDYFGHPVSPLESIEAAVSTWPEYATAVGVWLREDSAITVIAPYGLSDLFEMVVRRNPMRVSEETYKSRTVMKAYRSRWPNVSVVEI
jgi:hypothetical protein